MPEEFAFASALTTKTEAAEAVEDLTNQIAGKLSPRPDLALLFVSSHHTSAAPSIRAQLQTTLNPGLLMGCTGEGVIGSEHEIERLPAMTLLAARLPGVIVQPMVFRSRELHKGPGAETLVREAGIPPDTRLILMFADPFSTPIDVVLEAVNAQRPGVPVIGGMASAGEFPGGNSLLIGNAVHHDGVVAVALAGSLEVDVIVSQGCRPVGPAFRITHAEGNTIEDMNGRPPLMCLQSVVTGLSKPDRDLLRNGIFVGRAVDSEKEQHGRGDFLVRGVLSINQKNGAITIADFVREGEVVQFHLRDAETAREDLEMLLTPRALFGRPAGAFLFSCNGRGRRLYEQPDGDISALQEFFPGIDAAGFFCAGEIGPIAGRNFLHGHTASLALIRPPAGAPRREAR